MLDTSLKTQLRGILGSLTHSYTLSIEADSHHESFDDLVELISEVADTSSNITHSISNAEGLKVSLLKNGQPTGISFRAVPTGHEFTSLLLAILNADGKGKNFPDEDIQARVKNLKGKISITTYASLSCVNCPDIVQAFNLMCVLNPNISHEMVDGAIYQDEINSLKIQGVPTVYADGKLLHVGRSNFGELLSKLEEAYGTEPSNEEIAERNYDLVVIGGGPAGSSAAIYAARKGMKVALIAERIGGQVNETVGIQNLISVPQTIGQELAQNLKTHIKDYPIDLFENRRVDKVDLSDKVKKVFSGRETYTAPYIIIATGATWRKLNVPNETTYIGRGVAFCTHCDGPFYKGKRVAVVGGGNSGVEAAIDLAAICEHVTLLEYSDKLKADNVLQDKARNTSNIEVLTMKQSVEVIGDGAKVTGLTIKDRNNDTEQVLSVDGIFIQIGLQANSQLFDLPKNKLAELEIDTHCRTNIPGVYAAGDCSTVPYKQIIIAMGEGAKAALSAFEDSVRNIC